MKGKLKSLAVIIRTWNNPYVESQVKRFLTFGVGKVLVVVNSTPDKGATRGYLGALMKDARVQVIDMFEGYSWSNALNRAMMAVQIANVQRAQQNKKAFRFVMPVSNEALFSQDDVERMLDEATDDPTIAVVGTSFSGRQKSNNVDLGRSYRHPRNTGMVIRIEVLGCHVPQFDSWCDQQGGMEDIEFILRILSLSDLQYRMLDLEVKLVVGVNFHQPTKEKREQAAMDMIVARWRSLFEKGTKERSRIDLAISEMGLEK